MSAWLKLKNTLCALCHMYVQQLVLLRFQKFCCRSVSVGFCKKNRGFRFGFCLSRFPPVVNVVRLCSPLHIKPAAVCYIFLCITPVTAASIQQRVTGGVKTTTCTQRHTCCKTLLVWQSAPPTSVASEHLYSSASHVFTDRRNRLGPKKADMLLLLLHNLPLISFKY